MATKVFLKARLDNLGKVGEEVIVKDGYARNYLIPKGLAVIINSTNKKLLERKKQHLILEENEWKKQLITINDKIVDVNLAFALKVNEKGVAFGSITAGNIASRFASAGLDLTQKQLSLTEPLKTLGEHSIEIVLTPEIKTNITISIVKEEESS